MTSRPSRVPSRASRPERSFAFILLSAGFIVALLPVLHWNLGTAATAMTYMVGTAVLITAGIVAVYLTGHTAEGIAGTEGEAQ